MPLDGKTARFQTPEDVELDRAIMRGSPFAPPEAPPGGAKPDMPWGDFIRGLMALMAVFLAIAAVAAGALG